MTDRSHITDVQIRTLLIHTVLGVELRTVALFVPYCLSSESYVQNWPNLVILRFSTLSLMIGTVVFEWYKDADADFRGSRTRAAYFCLSTAQTWWLRMLVFIYSGRCFSHLYKVDTKSFFIHLSCLCRSTPHQPSQDHDHCPVVHLCAFCSDELWRGFWFVKQDQTTMTIALLYCWAELWLDLLVGSRSWCRDIDSGVWSQECWWHYYSWKPIHYAKCRHCPPRPQWRCSRSMSVSPSCAWVLGRGHTLAEKSLWHRNPHR